jgi:hypothetical protein
VSLLPLPGELGTEHGGIGFIRGDSGDTFLPEPDVDSGLILEHRGQFGEEFAPGQAEFEEGVASVGSDLGGEHAGGGTPAFAAILAPFEEEDSAAGLGQLAGAGGTYRAASNYNDVKGLRHVRTEETF